MIVHYEHPVIRQKVCRTERTSVDLESFVRSALVSEDEDAGALGQLERKINGHIEITCKLIETLLKKGMLTMEEFTELLPHNNHRKVIAINDEWSDTEIIG